MNRFSLFHLPWPCKRAYHASRFARNRMNSFIRTFVRSFVRLSLFVRPQKQKKLFAVDMQAKHIYFMQKSPNKQSNAPTHNAFGYKILCGHFFFFFLSVSLCLGFSCALVVHVSRVFCAPLFSSVCFGMLCFEVFYFVFFFSLSKESSRPVTLNHSALSVYDAHIH